MIASLFGVGLLATLGVPLFLILALAAMICFVFSGGEVTSVVVEVYRISGQTMLLTIPLFTLAGYLMAESGSPKRILNLANALFGWMPGGVAIVGLVVCAFFTAFTGASGVTIIALGGLLYPILKGEGYSERFNLGLLTTSGSLGLLFPPSLPLILYGIVSEADIDSLFKAGLVPGIFLIIILSLYSLLNGGGLAKREVFSISNLWIAFKGAWAEALLPVGVLTGIYGGIVTTTEAAALTCFYVLMIEVFYYRDISITKDLPRITCESMALVGGILLILCCALGFTNYLIDEEIPMQVLALMKSHLHSKASFLFFLNIFLLIVGAMMDIFSAIVVVLPLILPIAEDFGVHPIHLAIIFLTNLEIGYMTPPVGINLFISSYRFGKPLPELYRATLPFLLLLFVALMVITYVPILSLWGIE